MITNQLGMLFEEGDKVIVQGELINYLATFIKYMTDNTGEFAGDNDLCEVKADVDGKLFYVRRDRIRATKFPLAPSTFIPNEQSKDYGRHYKYFYKGIKLDPYRILSVYNVTDPALQHAIKKLLRAGNSIKDLQQDIKEVIQTLERKLEMIKEDNSLTEMLREDEGN